MSILRLVIASPNGQIQQLFSKVDMIKKKYGEFAALLIVGNLFRPRELSEVDQELSSEEEALLRGSVKGA